MLDRLVYSPKNPFGNGSVSTKQPLCQKRRHFSDGKALPAKIRRMMDCLPDADRLAF